MELPPPGYSSELVPIVGGSGKWFGGLVAPQIPVTPLIQAKADELTRSRASVKKRQAAQTYAMVLNLLGQNGDPALRQRTTANLTSLAAEGVKTSKDAGNDLSALRSYRTSTIKEWGRLQDGDIWHSVD